MSIAVQRAGKSVTRAGRACRLSSEGDHRETGHPLATSAKEGKKIPGDITGSQHSQGVLEVCGVMTACAGLVYLPGSFEQNTPWLGFVVTRIWNQPPGSAPTVFASAAQCGYVGTQTESCGNQGQTVPSLSHRLPQEGALAKCLCVSRTKYSVWQPAGFCE